MCKCKGLTCKSTSLNATHTEEVKSVWFGIYWVRLQKHVTKYSMHTVRILPFVMHFLCINMQCKQHNVSNNAIDLALIIRLKVKFINSGCNFTKLRP